MLRFQHIFRPHKNEKPTFSDSSCLPEERFRDGLVWTVGETVGITKAVFSDFSGMV